MTDSVIFNIQDDVDLEWTATVDDVFVNIRSVWNSRSKHRHLTVILSDGTVLIDGRKIVDDYVMFSSDMYKYGMTGGFIAAKLPNIESTEDTRKYWSDNYTFAYIS